MKTIFIFILLISSLVASEYKSKVAGVAPVNNSLYIKECGACHFAYQPGLLPSNSWKKMMSNLESHFGADATLAQEDFVAISQYLEQNSAEKAYAYKRSYKIANSMRDDGTIIAISKTPYFIKEHKGIPKKYIEQESVKGLFNCIACHTTAQKGIYSERDILIPNYGRWDD
ncbi:diheme cytochrome c [Halarcobacter ebronensis]|uniref:Cytochrome C n=1 Tax=Halarcobacter ebronensis TaxID=1462615 RepID=A0A4Q1ANZ8_9BACT|nr:diheme cytochrome c [Halarcobacter ebronensis]QKF83516.1 diheme cytochrome c [Halarcobacter ebronensis]RXK08309.1 cytochrome C [Halarcobacter ebronensis]